ncbi:hypothetical protein B5807_03750 [Epicoccum nigrum]|uniref:Uncharacterized protein n=1 Tax=Epicoccum nigrum TaxID=105696 RepID=A0A1Y2M865_EPING|nr:hypothetical protein B5807_03750 [Epicoccum nigrum]
MDLILPNSLSALREDETFTRHNITIDPEAFLAVIRHAELGCRMGGEGQYFHNNVDKQSFEQLIPEDSALYDVFLLCFKDIGDHAWSFVPGIAMIRAMGPELAQFAKLSDEFLRTAVRIMNADTDFDNALELLSCCQEFVDECRVFEQFIHRLFDRIVEYRVFADQDGSRIKELNTRWDKVFPSRDVLGARVTEKMMSLVQRVNAAAPTYSVWDRFFNSEEVAANTENYKRSAEKQIAELTQWQAGLEDVYSRMTSIDKTIDLSLESTMSCERSLEQLKLAIGTIITDAERFAGSINTVVERLGNDMSDLEILMQISTADVQSARETWGAMRELSERLASMLSG